MFRRKDKIPKVEYRYMPQPAPEKPKKRYNFIQLEGALVERDERTGRLQLVPRGPLCVNVDRISGYYDNTVIVNSEKPKVISVEKR